MGFVSNSRSWSFIVPWKTSRLTDFLILATSILVVFWGLWKCYFFYDDYWMLGWVRFKPTLLEGALTQASMGYALRPFLDANLWLRVRIFGLNAAPYYVLSLLQHYCVTLLLYCLAKEIYLERRVAIIAALLFATAFSANSVINWITGSNYSLTYIAGLTSFYLFVLFRKRGSNRYGCLVGSVVFWVLSLFTTEVAISILPLYLLYDLTVARQDRKVRVNRKVFVPYLAYGVVSMVYLWLQVFLLMGDKSEYGGRLGIGPHVIGNFFNLIYLALPNYTAAPIRRFLDTILPDGWLTLAHIIRLIIFLSLVFGAIYVVRKGDQRDRFWLLWTLVTFFPYSLWKEEGLAAADRYLYLPAMGFFVLVARGLGGSWQKFDDRKLKVFVPVLLTGALLFNLVFHQIWIRQQIANGRVKRNVVVQLTREMPTLSDGTKVVLLIPEANFTDLEGACDLVYNNYVECSTVLGDSPIPPPSSGPYYILRVRTDGFSILDERP